MTKLERPTRLYHIIIVLRRMAHPVCSAVMKLENGKLVVGWVASRAYRLFYVKALLCEVEHGCEWQLEGGQHI
jgi:hypothetical protein